MFLPNDFYINNVLLSFNDLYLTVLYCIFSRALTIINMIIFKLESVQWTEKYQQELKSEDGNVLRK